MEKALVVSLHDVSPRTRSDCEKMIASLRSVGVARTSLLVIPDHHRRGHFLQDPDFCEWLRELVAAGHEAVIHGYTHRRERRETETVFAKGITRIYTQDEGEFFDIEEPAARELIGRAQREFAEAGLTPVGFIAPAWLLSAGAERAAAAAGCEYTTTLTTITDFKTGKVHRSQSVVYSVRNTWRRAASLLWNASLFRRLDSNPLLRIGLHPPDLHQPAIWRQILRLAAAAVEKRTVTTYATWVDSTRIP